MKSYKEFLTESSISIDKIKDPGLNKKALALLKKKQKVYYSPTDKEVLSWNDLKGDVKDEKELFKVTDYMLIISK